MPERLDLLGITSESICAARALLRWEQRDLRSGFRGIATNRQAPRSHAGHLGSPQFHGHRAQTRFGVRRDRIHERWGTWRAS